MSDVFSVFMHDSDGNPPILDAGLGGTTWPGSTAQSNLVTVPHKIGRPPKSVVITALGDISAFFTPSWGVLNLTKTTFDVRCVDGAGSPAYGFGIFFFWQAVG